MTSAAPAQMPGQLRLSRTLQPRQFPTADAAASNHPPAVWVSLARKIGDFACGAGQGKDVQSGIRTINDVDIAAIVDFYVVGLDGHLAALRVSNFYAARLGV